MAVFRSLFNVLLVLCTALVLVFLVVPVIALFLRIPPGDLISQLSNGVVTDALMVTAKTNAIAFGLTLLVGTPAAYFLATRRFPGRSVLITLIELPLVLPPAVAGIGLLAAFGRLGLLGGPSTPPASRSGSPRPRWCWRSCSSPDRSTSDRGSPRSRPSIPT